MELKAVKDEYKKYKGMLEDTLNQLDDQQFAEIIGEDNNSVSIILHHLAGNFKSRFTDFLTSDGEKKWRHRDQEFEPFNGTRQELMQYWAEAWEILQSALENINPKNLTDMVTIRGRQLTIREALLRSLAHFSFHVGQIVFIAKAILGDNWKTLTIPKGKSEEYNKNPVLEKQV